MTKMFQCNCNIDEWEFNRSLNGISWMAQKNQQLMVWYQLALR